MQKDLPDRHRARSPIPLLATIVAVVGLPGFAVAQPFNPDFRLTLTGGLVTIGDTIDSEVILDNDFDPVSGWNYFVSYPNFSLGLVNLSSGPGLATVFNGGPPEFEVLQEVPGVPAYQHAATINSAPPLFTIPPGTGRTLSIATYLAITQLGDADLSFLTAPTPSTVTDGGQQVWIPELVGATITGRGSPDPNYELFFDSPTLEAGSNEVRVLLNNTGDSIGAWSYAAKFDASQLDVTALQTGTATLLANNGSPPDFEDFDMINNGFVHVVVVNNLLTNGIPPGGDLELLVATISAPPDYIGESTLRFVAESGVQVLVVPLNLGIGVPPNTTPYCLTTNHSFDRGDCNDDGMFGIADAVFGLSVVFQGDMPNCPDACDANDSEQIDIADPVYTLTALFNGGTPPPGSGNCLMDPGPASFSDLACVDATACP